MGIGASIIINTTKNSKFSMKESDSSMDPVSTKVWFDAQQRESHGEGPMERLIKKNKRRREGRNKAKRISNSLSRLSKGSESDIDDESIGEELDYIKHEKKDFSSGDSLNKASP